MLQGNNSTQKMDLTVLLPAHSGVGSVITILESIKIKQFDTHSTLLTFFSILYAGCRRSSYQKK